jgi:hypothetical protein
MNCYVKMYGAKLIVDKAILKCIEKETQFKVAG